MRQLPGILVLALAASLLGAPRPAAACGAASLELGVRDLQDAPAANVAFVLEIEGATQTVRTSAAGLAAVPIACGVNGTPKTARIVSASGADGARLLMDENTAAGGLSIPLIEGETQRVPFRLSGTLLFVEPVAEPDQSAAFSALPPAPSPAAQPDAAAPPTASTPPIPQPSRPWWFWAAILVVLGVPSLLGLLAWWRTNASGQRRPR
ncbi:MAG TPA: hypothetical protein VF897_04465 [Roseiflexaceae bacterium]